MLLLKRKFCSFFFFFSNFPSLFLSLTKKQLFLLLKIWVSHEKNLPHLFMSVICMHLCTYSCVFSSFFFFVILHLNWYFQLVICILVSVVLIIRSFFFSFSLSLSHNETAVLAFENFGLTWEEFTPPLHVCHLHSFMHLFLCVFFFLLCYFTVELAFSTCHMHSCFSSSNYSTQWLFCFEPICRTFIIN